MAALVEGGPHVRVLGTDEPVDLVAVRVGARGTFQSSSVAFHVSHWSRSRRSVG